jgi:hypothetical protein
MSSTVRAPRRASPTGVASPPRRASATGPRRASATGTRRATSSPARNARPASLASLQRRAGGAAIDMALLLVVAGLLSARLEGMLGGVTRIRIDPLTGQRTVDAAASLPLWLPLAIFVALTAAYTIPLMAIWGRTLGGLVVGVRCLRADTGASPGWQLSTRRWFALYGAAGLLSFAPVIGPFAWLLTLIVGLSPMWDGTRLMRGYADRLGGDLVVDVPRSR